MKKYGMIFLVTLFALCAAAPSAPVKVMLLDFSDETGVSETANPELAVSTRALADKAIYALAGQLLENDEITLIDRRDYLRQMDALQLRDDTKETPYKPSFLQAAQALNADVVLRGVLVSLSSRRQNVNQGGHASSHVTLNMRVAVEALDATGGAVLALREGAAERKLRQSEAVRTVYGEDDVYALLNECLAEAMPGLLARVVERVSRDERETIRMTITTTADPALVEIDGLLIGTTPIEDFEVYKGDHVLTVGKPGYRDLTKKILFREDVRIEVPMIRVELSAEEWKDVLEKIRLNVISGEPGIVITPLE